ncbi:MAG TPA: HAMP domain-containing sensor histidine kinase [Bacteroidales bacterium]|nr:HAMP domain-containing sensor histidine kinase [Bacteroidales bacterium]
MLFYLRRSNKKVEYQREIILKKNIELNNLNQTKDKFISIIAHDLKSPFNSLLGLLQDMIRNFDEYDDDEKLNLLKGVSKSSFNTYNLLINLLDWTMAQRNGFQNKPEKVVVKDAVEKVFQFLETRAKQKNHRLESFVGDSIVAFVDPDILSNILINLVNNAIKFTPLGGHIAVRATIEENTVSICIEDNGIGIPQDKIHKLFDLDSDFKRVGTSDELGTGLGLVMVKDFVKTSNGTISVQSNEDKGSTFCVKLPVSENT